MFSTLKNPALVKLYILPLIFVASGSMTWAISVLYALDLGASILQVNLITTIRSAMSILLLVPFGILSDRFGRRPMLLFPRIIVLIGLLIRTFATHPNHLLLAAFVGGFAGGGFFPVLLSMVADVAEPEDRQEVISTLYLFSGIGMFLGPLIGSLLLTMPQVSLRNLYQIHVIAMVGTLLYMATQIQETKPDTPKSEQTHFKIHISDLIHRSDFQALLATTLLFSFYRSIINTYIPIYARVDLNLTDAEVSSLSIYRNLAVVIIRFSCATFLTGAPITILFLSALALGGLAGLAAPLANSYLLLILIRLLAGLSHGATMILGSTLVAVETKTENRGVANSIYNVAQSIGGMANVFTSPIAESQGLSSVFLLGGASALTATLPILIRRRHTHQT